MEGYFFNNASLRLTCMEQESENVCVLAHQGNCYDNCPRAVSHVFKDNIPNDKKNYFLPLWRVAGKKARRTRSWIDSSGWGLATSNHQENHLNSLSLLSPKLQINLCKPQHNLQWIKTPSTTPRSLSHSQCPKPLDTQCSRTAANTQAKSTSGCNFSGHRDRTDSITWWVFLLASSFINNWERLLLQPTAAVIQLARQLDQDNQICHQQTLQHTNTARVQLWAF